MKGLAVAAGGLVSLRATHGLHFPQPGDNVAFEVAGITLETAIIFDDKTVRCFRAAAFWTAAVPFTATAAEAVLCCYVGKNVIHFFKS